MFKNFFIRQMSHRIQLVFQMMLAYTTARLLSVYSPEFLRLIRRYAAVQQTFLASVNPVAVELQGDANYCYMLSWFLGVEVHGVTCPTNMVDDYELSLPPARRGFHTLVGFWNVVDIDPVFGNHLEAYLMRYLTDDKVTGWDVMALDRTRDPSEDMFVIRHNAVNTILLNDDVAVAGDLMLTPGLILIVGTHRSGKTSLLNRLHIVRTNRGVYDHANATLHEIDRLTIQEPDAVSGKVPLEPISIFRLTLDVGAVNNRTIFIDSLTAIQEQLEGILKTGGINFGIFEYIDSLVQLSYHVPFIASMSFEANELSKFVEKFKGRVPNIIIANSPGRAELFCRGSFPNPHNWDNGQGFLDRNYTMTILSDPHNGVHNF